MGLEIIFTPSIGTDYMFMPTPAQFTLPAWYKKIPSTIDGLKRESNGTVTNATIKKCMPVFDALSTGYIIPIPVDVEVKLEEGKSIFYADNWTIDWHDSKQVDLHTAPYKQFVPKFINPWSIQTSPGTSCLFLQPFHNDLPFQILEGVVDTDTYTVPVNFPFVLKDQNWEGIIPAGTPMVQVVPFRREEWTMSIGTIDNYSKMKEVEKLLHTETIDRYKKLFRKKKKYT